MDPSYVQMRERRSKHREWDYPVRRVRLEPVLLQPVEEPRQKRLNLLCRRREIATADADGVCPDLTGHHAFFEIKPVECSPVELLHEFERYRRRYACAQLVLDPIACAYDVL